MTIIRIQYIFLLLLINSIVFAKEINISFEILNVKENYSDIVQKKALELKIKGFECYIIKHEDDLSLRCNDSRSTQDMQENIKKFKDEKVSFVVINKNEKKKKREYKTLNEFYLGYDAFNKGDYKKALEIFEYNYKQQNNNEHAYAYALALLKNLRYEESLKVLQEYKKDKNSNKLYGDVATTYMYKELDKKNYKQAHRVVDNYFAKSDKLHKMIHEREINASLKSKEYKKAEELTYKYKLKNKIFDIDYLKALDLVHLKKYQEANTVLAPYFYKEPKANDLLISNLLSISNAYYSEKKYQEALDTLSGYRNISPKANDLYNDIVYTRALENGWKMVETQPDEALSFFREACQIKKDYSCYSGMMYSYYNLKVYDKSLYLAQQLYEVDKKDELSIVAMRSALKMEKFDDAKYWFDNTENKKGIDNPYLLEAFLTIDEHISRKDYKEAASIMEYLLPLYPNNNNVLEKQMQLHVANQEYEKAKDVALKILSADSNSLGAKYTLSLYDFENKNYDACVDKLNDMSLTQPYQKNLLYRCDAYLYAEKKDMNSAMKSIEKIDDNNTKSAFYLDIGNIYKNKGYVESIRAYKEAKKYRGNDFDLELILLYAMKDFTQDDTLDKELMYAHKHYPMQSEKLKKFKIDYQKDRLFSYYKNHLYSRCYRYARSIENELHDKDVYRMGGWCAYSLEKYDESKERFAKINLMFGESSEDIYAYALSCYQNKEYDRAIESLDRLKLIDNEKYALLISTLYMDLHKQESARKILLQLPQTQQRDAMLVKLNKSFTKEEYDNSASVGMYYESQTGLNGKNKFDKYIVPIDYDYYNKEDKYHFYFDGDLLYLYNGYLTDNGGSPLDFGLNATTKEDDLTSDIGFMPKVGVDYNSIKAQIGLTPVGAKITPELTWLLSADYIYNKLMFNIQFKQAEIEETMLSFVGERAVRDSLEVNWGRMLKRGFEAGISYEDDLLLSFNVGYFPQIFGLNVINNSEVKSTVSAIYHPKVESISYVDLGALLAYDSYEKNSNLFTYGHGGYFSPQDFWLGSIFTEFGDIVNNKFYYQAKLSVGLEGFMVDDVEKFPLSNDPALIGIEKGYTNGGLTYKGAIQFGYNLTDNLDLISGIAMEKMYSYEVKQASFAFVYRFTPNKYRTFNTFRLNHRVDQIIK